MKRLKEKELQPSSQRDVKKYTIELPRILLDDIRLAAAELTKKTGKTVLVRSIVITALEKWKRNYDQEKQRGGEQKV